MQTLNVIGAGRVGQSLAHLWHAQHVFAVQQVLTRTPQRAQDACTFIGAGQPTAAWQDLRAADVWMLAVPDAALAQVASDLAAHAQSRSMRPALVFHCSGALTAAHLVPLVAQGWQVASAHCILSFAAPASAVQQFSGTACALEGQPAACTLLRDAFTAIGARCFDVASDHKVLYHAAAVFATNFLPVLQTVAEDTWLATGVPAELIPSLRSALLANAVANINRLGPAGALTGPAARGDVEAIARQAQVVTKWDPQAGVAYEALSALALRIANTTKDAPATQATKI